MKLLSKLVLFNTFSKVLVMLVFILLVPVLIERVAVSHTDQKLTSIKETLLKNISDIGLKEFLREDSLFASYNILKEQFISIERISEPPQHEEIRNTQRNIENAIVDYRVLSYTFENHGEVYLMEVGQSLQTIEELTHMLKTFAVWTTVILLTLTLLLDISFTNFLLRPFKKIIGKLETIRHPSTFAPTSISTTTADFTYLDNTINEMMSKINIAFENEKEFIANVSHELLTPISILQNRLENILSAGELDAATEHKIVESQKTLGRMSRIIRTLLMISRIGNEQYLKEDKVKISSLVNEVMEEIHERLTEKNLSCSIDIAHDAEIDQCNRSLLFTMLFNIVNNAIRYNVQDGKIMITTRATDNEVLLDISDTGAGIDPDQRQNIFRRFKRSSDNGTEGYGLGLAIVKTIADFHHILITVESEKGKGSTFTLHFNTV